MAGVGLTGGESTEPQDGPGARARAEAASACLTGMQALISHPSSAPHADGSLVVASGPQTDAPGLHGFSLPRRWAVAPAGLCWHPWWPMGACDMFINFTYINAVGTAACRCPASASQGGATCAVVLSGYASPSIFFPYREQPMLWAYMHDTTAGCLSRFHTITQLLWESTARDCGLCGYSHAAHGAATTAAAARQAGHVAAVAPGAARAAGAGPRRSPAGRHPGESARMCRKMQTGSACPPQPACVRRGAGWKSKR